MPIGEYAPAAPGLAGASLPTAPVPRLRSAAALLRKIAQSISLRSREAPTNSSLTYFDAPASQPSRGRSTLQLRKEPHWLPVLDVSNDSPGRSPAVPAPRPPAAVRSSAPSRTPPPGQPVV